MNTNITISTELNALLDLFVKEFVESINRKPIPRPHIGSLANLKSYPELLKVKENFNAAITNNNMDYVINTIFKTGNDRLINAVSNRVKLESCLGKTYNNNENVLKLSKAILTEIEELNQKVDKNKWEDLVVRGKYNLKNRYDIPLQNDIDAFIKEFFFVYNINDQKYPLWNRCVKKAESLIKAIEGKLIENNPIQHLSIIEFIDFLKNILLEKLDGRVNEYNPYYILDKFFNIIVKIKTGEETKPLNRSGELKKFYIEALKYKTAI